MNRELGVKHDKGDFIAQMQKKVAVSSVGPSAVRGQDKGTLDAVRDFLAKIHLTRISRRSDARFQLWLNRQTKCMAATRQRRTIPWGVARKSLNLFLRDAFYNRYLHDKYQLGPIEQLLEVPLDGVVGRYIVRKAEDRELLPWPGLKRLTTKQSQALQEAATDLAADRGVARVHLDIFVWPEERFWSARATRGPVGGPPQPPPKH